MKKLLLIAVMAPVSYYATAQSKTHHTHTEFGVKGGVNIANVSISNSPTPDSRLSFHLGGLAHIHFSKRFALQPEIVFSGQGYKTTVAGTDYAVRLNYINVPVLGQFMFGDGFRFETGPQVGFLVSANREGGGSKTNISDNYKMADLSWAFGLGYITHSRFGVDL